MLVVPKAVLAGAFAKEFLSSSSEAEIIGVYRRGLYLENTSGRLACIGAQSIGPGPLNLLCKLTGDFDFTQIVEPGSTAEIRDSWMRLGSWMTVDISRLMEWEPEQIPGGWDLDFFLENLPFLAQWIAETGPREGLAPFITQIIRNEKISSEGTFQKISWQGMADFGHWFLDSLDEGKTIGFPSTACRLVGLGPGLTPSGDDFWCGVMLALRTLGYWDILERVSSTVLKQAKRRTNKISRAHQECAAAGQGAHALHETISAMGVNDEARLRSALCELDGIGHTSGWDSLAGVVCVMVSVAVRRGRRILA